mmetsp:Transcript_70610/g.199290  ORF Transcript_70610/g.199290 Transcript_70610/m.199290 type:complete len:256 (+) Transcript_70610:1-768(+)
MSFLGGPLAQAELLNPCARPSPRSSQEGHGERGGHGVRSSAGIGMPLADARNDALEATDAAVGVAPRADVIAPIATCLGRVEAVDGILEEGGLRWYFEQVGPDPGLDAEGGTESTREVTPASCVPSSGPVSVQKWLYTPCNGKSVPTRHTPDIEGKKTAVVLKPGDVFEVVQEKLGPDGVLFLKLAGGAGWVFDHKPGVGVMCVREERVQVEQAPPSPHIPEALTASSAHAPAVKPFRSSLAMRIRHSVAQPKDR